MTPILHITLWVAWSFSARAVLYDRKWDFEDLVKDGDVLAVYNATTRATCSSYCLAWQCDAVPVNPSPGGCSPSALSDGFTYNATSGLCFKIHNINMDWDQAKSQCTDDGYRLIVLNNALKADFMTNLLDSDPEYTNDGYWMGLSEANDWEDGTSLTYNNWFDTSQVLDNGKCGLLYRDKNYKWKSEHCNSSRGFICEAA